MIFDINPMRKKNAERNKSMTFLHFLIYHFDRLIIRIDEIKFIEKIVVDQKHDLIARRFGFECSSSFDDDANPLVE